MAEKLSDKRCALLTKTTVFASIIGTAPRLGPSGASRGIFIDLLTNFCYNEGTSPRPRGNTRRGF